MQPPLWSASYSHVLRAEASTERLTARCADVDGWPVAPTTTIKFVIDTSEGSTITVSAHDVERDLRFWSE
jgi:hypothetical protein